MRLHEIRDPDRWKRYTRNDGDIAFAENPVNHKIQPVKITGGPFMGKMYKVEYAGDPNIEGGYGMWAEDDTGIWDTKEEGEIAQFNKKLGNEPLEEFENSDPDECTRCLGLRHHPSDSSKKCPECKGTGKCPDAVTEMYGEDEKESDDATCDWCGGQMQWCSVCTQWTRTCCVDYGTCMCS